MLYFSSFLNTRSTPKVLWAAYDEYADTNEWCQLDQMRLISLDFMFRRYLAYHKNHLTFKVSNTEGYTQWLPSCKLELETIAFEAQTFNKDKPYEPSREIRFSSLQEDLQAISEQEEDFLWIHMHDLRCLDDVAKTFQLHKYAQRFFMDLRWVDVD